MRAHRQTRRFVGSDVPYKAHSAAGVPARTHTTCSPRCGPQRRASTSASPDATSPAAVPPSPPPPHTPAQENSNCCKADHPCSSPPAHKLIAAQPPADRTPSNGQMRQGRGQGHTAARATPTNARAIAVQQRAKGDDLEAAHRGEPLQAQSGRGGQRHEQPSRTPSVATRGGPGAAQILMPLVSFHDEGFDGQVSQPLHAGTEMRHSSPKGKKNELWRGAEQVSPRRCLLITEPGGSNEANAPRDGDRGRGAE